MLQSTISYTVNARDQITLMETRNSTNAVIASETNLFDAEGNRISRTVGGTTTSFVYDVRGRQVKAGPLALELNDSGTRVAEVNGANRTERVFDGLKLMQERSNGVLSSTYRWGLQLIGEAKAGAATTILQDGFRSPVVVTNSSGAVVNAHQELTHF